MARREKVFNEHRQKLTCGGERLCGEFVFFVAVFANCVKTLPPRADRRMRRGRTYTGGCALGCVIFLKKVCWRGSGRDWSVWEKVLRVCGLKVGMLFSKFNA